MAQVSACGFLPEAAQTPQAEACATKSCIARRPLAITGQAVFSIVDMHGLTKADVLRRTRALAEPDSLAVILNASETPNSGASQF